MLKTLVIAAVLAVTFATAAFAGPYGWSCTTTRFGNMSTTNCY